MEDSQRDIFFIGRTAQVRAELFASLTNQCSATKLPQVRRGLFPALAEFQK